MDHFPFFDFKLSFSFMLKILNLNSFKKSITQVEFQMHFEIFDKFKKTVEL